MNIFILDKNPVRAAQMHCDKHITKMVLETAQLLSTAVRLTGGDYGYKATHKNHPCSVWARTNKGNFNWLKNLGIELCKEYSYRYHKIHKSFPIIRDAPDNTIPDGSMTEFVQAMPVKYKHVDAITAYRLYYKNEKFAICKYTSRDWPNWLIK